MIKMKKGRKIAAAVIGFIFKGDGEAKISSEEQQKQTLEAITQMIGLQ